MIYNYELVLDELTQRGFGIDEHHISEKYVLGYHRHEKRVFGHIKLKLGNKSKGILNVLPFFSQKSLIGEVERVLSPLLGSPHTKKKNILFYWLPFTFNENKPGIEILTIRV
jgi:hypothetical protein